LAATGDKAGVFRLLGYAPAYEVQAAFHGSSSRYRVLLAGRRAGKTKACGAELAYELLKDGKRAWIVGPKYDHTERVWREVLLFLLHGLGVRPTRKQERFPSDLLLPWGSYLACKSTEPGSRDSLVGDSLDAVVCDEWARAPGDVWGRELAANLIDRQGWAVFASTPRGRLNHFHDLWTWTREFPDWEGFHATSYMNPYLPPGDVEKERRTKSPELFAQEYLAEWVSLEGMVYPEFREETHVGAVPYLPELGYGLAFDFGTTDASPFACLWLQRTPEGVVRVWHELVVPGRSTLACCNLVEEEHAKLRRRFPELPERAEWATGDSAARDGRVTLTEKCALVASSGVQSRQQTIEAGIEVVRQLLRPLDGLVRLRVDRSCDTLIDEFESYCRRHHREGSDVRDRPVAEHNHCLDALRYDVVSMGRPPPSVFSL